MQKEKVLVTNNRITRNKKLPLKKQFTTRRLSSKTVSVKTKTTRKTSIKANGQLSRTPTKSTWDCISKNPQSENQTKLKTRNRTKMFIILCIIKVSHQETILKRDQDRLVQVIWRSIRLKNPFRRRQRNLPIDTDAMAKTPTIHISKTHRPIPRTYPTKTLIGKVRCHMLELRSNLMKVHTKSPGNKS